MNTSVSKNHVYCICVILMLICIGCEFFSLSVQINSMKVSVYCVHNCTISDFISNIAAQLTFKKGLCMRQWEQLSHSVVILFVYAGELKDILLR